MAHLTILSVKRLMASACLVTLSIWGFFLLYAPLAETRKLYTVRLRPDHSPAYIRVIIPKWVSYPPLPEGREVEDWDDYMDKITELPECYESLTHLSTQAFRWNYLIFMPLSFTSREWIIFIRKVAKYLDRIFTFIMRMHKQIQVGFVPDTNKPLHSQPKQKLYPIDRTKLDPYDPYYITTDWVQMNPKWTEEICRICEPIMTTRRHLPHREQKVFNFMPAVAWMRDRKRWDRTKVRKASTLLGFFACDDFYDGIMDKSETSGYPDGFMSGMYIFFNEHNITMEDPVNARDCLGYEDRHFTQRFQVNCNARMVSHAFVGPTDEVSQFIKYQQDMNTYYYRCENSSFNPVYFRGSFENSDFVYQLFKALRTSFKDDYKAIEYGYVHLTHLNNTFDKKWYFHPDGFMLSRVYPRLEGEACTRYFEASHQRIIFMFPKTRSMYTKYAFDSKEAPNYFQALYRKFKRVFPRSTVHSLLYNQIDDICSDKCLYEQQEDEEEEFMNASRYLYDKGNVVNEVRLHPFKDTYECFQQFKKMDEDNFQIEHIVVWFAVDEINVMAVEDDPKTSKFDFDCGIRHPTDFYENILSTVNRMILTVVSFEENVNATWFQWLNLGKYGKVFHYLNETDRYRKLALLPNLLRSLHCDDVSKNMTKLLDVPHPEQNLTKNKSFPPYIGYFDERFKVPEFNYDFEADGGDEPDWLYP